MIHKILRRVRVNFRQSKSDRAATGSYRDYHKRIAHLFKQMPVFKKKEKHYD